VYGYSPIDAVVIGSLLVLIVLSYDRTDLSGFFLWCGAWLGLPLYVVYRLYRAGFLS
jgi:hypothetical protein